MYILSFSSTLEDLSKLFNTYLDKFTSNPAFAGIITFVLFIFIYIGVSSFYKK